MSGPAKCRSCGAPIIWALTRKGKNIPLDVEPDDVRGTQRLVVRVERGQTHANAFHRDNRDPEGTHYHVAHWATCPNAEQHRKPR